jgi:hypothetical protein
MFKTRIRSWGFNEAIKETDWQAMALLQKMRADSGKRLTEFLVHGKRRTAVELRNYIKKKNMSEESFLKSIEIGATIPSHIRCHTPEPSSPSPGSAILGCLPEPAANALSSSSSIPGSMISSFSTVMSTTDSGICLSQPLGESLLASGCFQGSFDGPWTIIKPPQQGGDPMLVEKNAAERPGHGPEIKADNSSNRSSGQSLRPGSESGYYMIFEIFADRSTIEILIIHRLKAIGHFYVYKIHFSSMVDQVMKTVSGSHVADVIDRVIEDEIQEPAGCLICYSGCCISVTDFTDSGESPSVRTPRKTAKGTEHPPARGSIRNSGRIIRNGDKVVSKDQNGAPPVLSAKPVNNDILKARSDSGYASSLAASKWTRASPSESSGLGSDCHSGQRSPRIEDRSGSNSRRKWSEAHPGRPSPNGAGVGIQACQSGLSHLRETSRSTSPGVGQSPATSLDFHAISEGEMSFAMSADSDDSLEDWEATLDPELIRIRSRLVQQLVETYISAESEVHSTIQYIAPGGPPPSSHGSSNHTSSSLSRTTQKSDTSLGKHKISRDEDEEDLRDEDRPSGRKRTRVTTESISLDGRLLACPYYKYNPIRFSEHNIQEKHYRGCSSGYLSTISRLKQHLYRVHRRPEFYCRSCFQVFQSEDELDVHTRTRPSCEPCAPKFAEKMTVEQMAGVKRRKPGKTPSDTWFAIFRILFPEASLPESPYADSVSTNAIRAFMDHFQRRGQALLSGLIHEQLGSTLVLHSDQQRILDSALESAIAQLVMQIAPANQEIEDQQAPLEIQSSLNGDVGFALLDEAAGHSNMLGQPDHSMASSIHDGPHNPVTWSPIWTFEGLDDLGDIETVFN